MTRSNEEESLIFVEKRKQVLKKMRILRLFAEKSLNMRTIGNYRSFFPGTGMDFSEIRGYYFGDDIRNISWPTTAKNRKPFVKSFKEDRSLNVIIALDCSRSMAFWSKTQRQDNIALIAACLAFSAIKSGDRAGLVLFSDRIIDYYPARNLSKNAISIIDSILRVNPSGTANYSTLQSFLLQVLKDPSAIFIISDFFLSEKEIDDMIRRLLVMKVRHRIYPFSFWDQLEYELPELGYLWLKDLETGRSELMMVEDTLRKRYHETMVAKRDYLKNAFENSGIPFLPILEGEDYGKQLFDFFKRKGSYRRS
jgi:uncharacterized protein (DUF58 family)